MTEMGMINIPIPALSENIAASTVTIRTICIYMRLAARATVVPDTISLRNEALWGPQ